MKSYAGPVCFVGHDHEAADGRMLEGGWHYTVVPATDPDGDPLRQQGPDESPPTMPGEKLSHANGSFHMAAENAESHRAKHHKNLVIVAPEGNVGTPETDEEYEATHRHLDRLEERIRAGELHPHERHHMMAKPEHVATVRDWLKEAQARR